MFSFPLIWFRLIQEQATADRNSASAAADMSPASSRVDKILIHFLHAVFVIALSMFWNRYRTDPQDFGFIATMLMVAFSLLVLVSIASSIYYSAQV